MNGNSILNLMLYRESILPDNKEDNSMIIDQKNDQDPISQIP